LTTKADKLLEKMEKEGRHSINVCVVTKKLKKMGCKSEDINMAIRIVSCLSYIEPKIFDNMVEILFSVDDVEGIVGYDAIAGAYTVNVQDLAAKVEGSELSVFYFGREARVGGKVDPIRKATLDEKIILLAAMSARFRWQETNEDNMFSIRSIYYNPQISSYVSLIRGMMNQEIQCDDIFGPRYEFDVRVMEKILLGQLEVGTTEQEVYDIIRLKEPSIGFLT